MRKEKNEPANFQESLDWNFGWGGGGGPGGKKGSEGVRINKFLNKGRSLRGMPRPTGR